MELLPVEIRLNILEFAGERLNTSDKDIVSRIQRYEPEFSYDEWLKKVQESNRIVNDALSPEMINIYNYVMSHKIEIYFGHETYDHRVFPNIHGKIYENIAFKGNFHEVEELVGLFSKAGYDLPSTYENHPKHCFCILKTQDKNILLRFIIMWSLLGQRSRDTYSWTIRIKDLPELISIFDILNTYTTLSSYLRDALWKYNWKRKEKTPVERLYDYLSSFCWRYHESIPDVPPRITIHGAPYEEYTKVIEDISKIIPIKEHWGSDLTFHITLSHDIPDLEYIDYWFHPHIPNRISNFKGNWYDPMDMSLFE